MKLKIKNLNRGLLVSIIISLLVLILGTYAWLSWRSNETNLKLTVGNIDDAIVTISPYKINASILPALSYEEEEYASVTAVNNSNNKKNIEVFYEIDEIALELVNENFKYTITKSTDGGTTYTEYKSGDFSLAVVNEEFILLTEDIPKNTTYKYRIYTWLYSEDIDENNYVGSSFIGELNVRISNIDSPPSGAEILIENANPADLMYDDANITAEQKANIWTIVHDDNTTDYRYIGATPNNWIKFNGGEDWRIIGVFDGKIKLIKNTRIADTSYSFDYKNTGVGSSTGSGSNDWTDSQLMYMLNSPKYRNIDGTYETDLLKTEILKSGYTVVDSFIKDSRGNIIYELGKVPESVSAGASTYNGGAGVWTLNSTAFSQIDKNIYYLGSATNGKNSASAWYDAERGATTPNGNANPATWNGYVGLIYPSDYAYTYANNVNTTCFNNTSSCTETLGVKSWLFNDIMKNDTYSWTISSVTSYVNRVFAINNSANFSTRVVGTSSGVFPVVYLKSDIVLTGTGTVDDPYEIVQPPITALTLIANANSSTLMYNATGISDEQKANIWAIENTGTMMGTDYRYIGATPNNWIKFNDDEYWRIIGIFDNKIKLIKNTRIDDTNYMFDYKQNGVGTSTTAKGSNNWTDAQIMYMLNAPIYENSDGTYNTELLSEDLLIDGYTLNQNFVKDTKGNIIYELGKAPAYIASGATSYSGSAVTWRLNENAINQIDKNTYYLSGTSDYARSAASWYDLERSSATTWTGYVGFLYPSDYAFTYANGVNTTCFNNTGSCSATLGKNSWLFNEIGEKSYYPRTISYLSSYSETIFHLNSSNATVNISDVNSAFAVLPSVYLKSEIELIGKGTYEEPYEIVE